MRYFYISLFLISALFQPAFGQKLVNGDLEGAASMPSCGYILTPDYVSAMSNSGCSFGDTLDSKSVPTIFYIQDSACLEGKPHHGKSFIGVSAQNNKTDRISLMMDTLTINFYGRKYILQYWYKKPRSSSAIKLYIGASNDCSTFGTAFDTLTAPTDTAWHMRSDTFLPAVGTKYITVMAENSSATRMYTFIDDFTLTPDMVSVEHIKGILNMSVYPNPLSSAATVSLGSEAELPCTVSICDMTGRVISELKNVNTREIQIDRGSMNTGIYMLRLVDNKGSTGITRLQVN